MSTTNAGKLLDLVLRDRPELNSPIRLADATGMTRSAAYKLFIGREWERRERPEKPWNPFEYWATKHEAVFDEPAQRPVLYVKASNFLMAQTKAEFVRRADWLLTTHEGYYQVRRNLATLVERWDAIGERA